MKKESVLYLKQRHDLSIKQACLLLNLARSMYYYGHKVKSDDLLINLLNQLAAKHPSYGFWKLYHMIRKKGYKRNHKRVYRVYKQLKMNLQRRTRKRLPTRVKTALEIPENPNEIWSMDFMSDTLQCGRRFRTLNIIDDYNREVLAIETNYSIPAYAVIEQVKRLIEQRGKPQQIRVDNGPEFISNTFIDFCNEKRIEIRYIQPGKPMQNAYIERFNRSYRQEILDAYLFKNLQEVENLTQRWIEHYNQYRPHDSLHNMSPMEFLLNNNQLNQQHQFVK